MSLPPVAMRHRLALSTCVFLAAVSGILSPARAAPGDIYLTVYAAWRYPLIDQGTGLIHAFSCIELDLNSGIKEDCYGFYPKKAQISRITLATGGTLARDQQKGWYELGTSHTFQEQASPPNHLVLFDAKRDLTWTLSVPTGGSTWSNGGAPQPFVKVTGVQYDDGGSMILGGAGVVASEWDANPTRFTNVTASFKRKISTAQRAAIIAALNSANSKSYALTSSNCIDVVDMVVASGGAKRPPRYSTQTPTDYVKRLIQLNP